MIATREQGRQDRFCSRVFMYKDRINGGDWDGI